MARSRRNGAPAILDESTRTSADPPQTWLALTYEPVAPFSLRPSLSTSAGGKTLLVPTPYAIKLALVDAEARRKGAASAEGLLTGLRTAAMAILPARRATVTNTFERVLKLYQAKQKKTANDEEDDGDAEQGRPFVRTIRYREICLLSGPLVVAVGLRDPALVDAVLIAAHHVNYFGRRGGFFQLIEAERVSVPDPRASVVDPLGWTPRQSPVGDVACLLDDLGPEASLSTISPFTSESASWERQRVQHMRILAMRRVASSAHFTLYERVGG
jgi:hypothetical protein